MRTIAIGDIHGCLTAFDALLAAAAVQRDDHLILLGDMVDRGPDSKGVLDRVIGLHHAMPNIAVLRGNHEELMLAARDTTVMYQGWLRVGGGETLESYGWNPYDQPVDGGGGEWVACVPAWHWEFLQNGLLDLAQSA